MSSSQETILPPPSADATDAAVTKKKKAPPPNLVIPPPRPKLSKEERRALQEQQRAAKSSTTSGNKGGTASAQPTSIVQATSVTKSTPPDVTTKSVTGQPMADVQNRVDTHATEAKLVKPDIPFVSHLSPYMDPSILFDTGAVLRPVASSTMFQNNSMIDFATTTLHPAIIKLGYQYATGEIRGANGRCRSMLQCYSTVLHDLTLQTCEQHVATTNSDWRSTIENTILKPAFTYWTEYCRPHSVSMGNAFTFLKTAVNTFDRDVPLEQMISTLLESIAAYIVERIDYAKAAIAETACTKLLFRRVEQSLSKMEVLLTYGHSEAVLAVLSLAISSRKKNLRIIVVDSPPLLEGRALLQKLQHEAAKASLANESIRIDTDSCHVEFAYIHLHAVSYVLPTVSKVLVGAAALQTDGSVTGRIGTAIIALAAHTKNIPVLVCSETHKISNRGIPLESLTQNELFGNNHHSSLTVAEENPNRIDLLYDLTPASYVSGIVTELGIVPPSSVAVLLRELNQPSVSERQ